MTVRIKVGPQFGIDREVTAKAVQEDQDGKINGEYYDEREMRHYQMWLDKQYPKGNRVDASEQDLPAASVLAKAQAKGIEDRKEYLRVRLSELGITPADIRLLASDDGYYRSG